MSTMSLPNEIHNDTPADGSLVEQNYAYIENFVNHDVVHADGSVTMSGPLMLPDSDPIQDNQATRKSYVDAMLPVGMIVPYGGEVAPAGGKWGLCDGHAISKTTYNDLFAVIGIRYGGTAAGTTFNLPNMKARFPIGADAVVGGAFEHTGKAGGTFTVPLPKHDHLMPHGHNVAHTHEHPHTHTINHDHDPVTTGGGAHTHDLSTSVRDGPSGATNSFVRAGAAGTTAALTNNPVIDADSPPHTHSVNLPVTTGKVSGQPNEATTLTSSIVNSGQPTITSTSDAGVTGPAPANAPITMTQPFVVFSFIIRLV